MSPKKSRPRAVSPRPEQQSAPDQAAGSDGDLRHDQAAEPSSPGIASNDHASHPISPDPTEEEQALWRDLDICDGIDLTLRKAQQRLAECRSLLATWGNRAIARQEHHPSRENSGEKGKRLDPEKQSLLDEVAHILSFATPSEKAILLLGIEGVKQKAAQLKALRSKSLTRAVSQKASVRKG